MPSNNSISTITPLSGGAVHTAPLINGSGGFALPIIPHLISGQTVSNLKIEHDFTFQKSRSEVEEIVRNYLLLADQERSANSEAVLIELLRKYPDIAQSELDSISIWGISEIRKSSSDLIGSRSVFVKELVSATSKGIYHVSVLHGGGTILASNATNYKGRTIYDAISISPLEFEKVAFSFLKTVVFLSDPIKHISMHNVLDTPDSRISLVKAYVEIAKANPFEAIFSGSESILTSDSHKCSAEPSEHITSSPLVSYKKTRKQI